MLHLHFHCQKLPPLHSAIYLGPQVAQEHSPQKAEKDLAICCIQLLPISLIWKMNLLEVGQATMLLYYVGCIQTRTPSLGMQPVQLMIPLVNNIYIYIPNN